MGLVTIVVILFAICRSNALEVIEGERVKLGFSYPCESTEFTLRLSNRVPFYNSADPNLSQNPNHQISNDNATESGECILRLTIDPVSRDDMGTYILTAYKDGNMIDYTRVWLNVKYPPGCVSCESMEYHREWVKLHCRAPAGSLPGQIECFQSGMRMPPLTAAEENDLILSQVILAKLVEDPVYCCSSILGTKQNMCECKDWAWDPVRDINHDITDPCAKTAESSPGSTTPDGPIEHIALSSSPSPASLTQTPTLLLKLIHSNRSVSENHVIGWIILSIFCVCLCFVCCHIFLLFKSEKYYTIVGRYFPFALFALTTSYSTTVRIKHIRGVKVRDKIIAEKMGENMILEVITPDVEMLK